MTPPLIGLCGYSAVGKDSVARLLAERHRVARLAFADELKREVAAAWHVDVALFHDAGLKDVSLHQLELARCTNVEFVAFHWHLADLGALKPRTVLQAWGDWVTSRDPLHYVRAVDAQLREVAGTEPQAVIVTDVRLHRENEWLRTHGGVSEARVPFIINRPLNGDYRLKGGAAVLKSWQLFDFALNGVA